MKIAILFCLLSSVAYGQLPDAPKPQLDHTQWAILAADAGIRTLDVYSTHQMLTRGYHELLLPKDISNHTPAMIAYGAGCVYANYRMQVWLTRHHKRTLAKVLGALDVAQVAPWAVHNLYLK